MQTIDADTLVLRLSSACSDVVEIRVDRSLFTSASSSTTQLRDVRQLEQPCFGEKFTGFFALCGTSRGMRAPELGCCGANDTPDSAIRGRSGPVRPQC